jgi:hypothetical protein
MTTVTRDDEAKMVHLRARLRKDVAAFEAAGLDERADAVRADIALIDAKLAAAKAAQQEEEAERWEAKRRQEAWLAAREREDEKRRSRAVAFVRDLFASHQPVEVGVVFDSADEAGIATADLLYAAGKLGLRRMGWSRSGTATIHDRGRGTWWGLPSLGGMLDLGPARGEG